MREKPEQHVVDKIREAGHVDYPYAQQDRFSMQVDLYETGNEVEPIYSGSLGELFDTNTEAEWGDTSPDELEALRRELVDTGSFRYGMGFWVTPKGQHPKDGTLNSPMKP